MYCDDNSFLDLSCLSFDEYVLIDCLKFKHQEDAFYAHSFNVTFVALSKQGFFNVFNEIKDLKIGRDKLLKLYDNQVLFIFSLHCVTIKYVTDEQHFKSLINSPCLDFYKCYYDGVKMYCTPETIQCYKTGEVQFTGKISLIPSVVTNIFNYNNHVKFKDQFWEANKDYISKDMTVDVPKIKIKYDTMKNDYVCDPDKFPTKSDILTNRASNSSTRAFGTDLMFVINVVQFELYKENVYDFINDAIFENTTTSLC
jgi:hypothetical protein